MCLIIGGRHRRIFCSHDECDLTSAEYREKQQSGYSKRNIDLLIIKIKVNCVDCCTDARAVLCFSFLLLEANALTGSVATEPARVGGVCLHFLHGT